VAIELMHLDSDDDLLCTFRRYLQRCGFSVFSTNSPSVCLERLWWNPPDLLILEPVLPDDRGQHVLSACLDEQGFPRVPVIALSRRSPHYFDRPIEPYHLKPIPVSALVTSIHSVLTRQFSLP